MVEFYRKPEYRPILEYCDVLRLSGILRGNVVSHAINIQYTGSYHVYGDYDIPFAVYISHKDDEYTVRLDFKYEKKDISPIIDKLAENHIYGEIIDIDTSRVVEYAVKSEDRILAILHAFSELF